jgi:pyrroloquinoline quinone biosynthesis protein E
MWTVVQAGNIHQLPALVDLAAELRFTNMVFSLDLNDWGQESWTERNSPVRADPGVLLNQADALMEQGRQLGLRVSFWSILDKFSTASRDHLCPWPFERAFVSSDMKVVPCCMIADPSVLHLGEAGGPGGFSAVWHGDNYEAFRRSHLDGNIPAACRGCYKG